MPRKEASLKGRPQHLVEFAEMLRAARHDASLTLKELSAKTSYSESYLSRVTNALELSGWDVTEAFLKGCGVVDLEAWRRDWEETKKRDEAFRANGAISAPPTAVAITTIPPKVQTGKLRAAEQAPTLTAFVRQAETKEQLIEAVRLLAARSGHITLRQLEQHTGIPKSTIRDWLAGVRRPSRLDDLVTRLGATPSEQRQFAQCLERVWTQRPPYLVIGSSAYTPIAHQYGGFCYELTLMLYDRNINSGGVWLVPGQSGAILGISLGQEHEIVGSIAPLPAITRGSMFTVGIWVTSPAAVARQEVVLQLELNTAERSWPGQLRVVLPVSDAAPAKASLPPVPPRSSTAPSRPTASRARISAEAAALTRWKAAANSNGPSVPRVAIPRPRTVPAAAVDPPAEPPAVYQPRHRKPGRARGPSIEAARVQDQTGHNKTLLTALLRLFKGVDQPNGI